MKEERDAKLKKGSRIVYQPGYRSRTSKDLNVLRVVTEAEFTRIDLIYFRPPKQCSTTIILQLDPDTYLLPHTGDKKLKLLRVDNIPLAPKVYKMVKGMTEISFSLYFEPLDHHCTLFSLIEKPTVRGNNFNIYKTNLLSQKSFSSILKN